MKKLRRDLEQHASQGGQRSRGCGDGLGSDMEENEEAEGQDRGSSGHRNACPPVSTCVHRHTSVLTGNQQVRGIRRYRECLEGGVWAGAHAGSQWLSPESAPGSEHGLERGHSARWTAGHSRHAPPAAQPGQTKPGIRSVLGSITKPNFSAHRSPLYASPFPPAPSALCALDMGTQGEHTQDGRNRLLI